MNQNRIHVSLSTLGYVSISGLTRAEFDGITGNLSPREYPARDGLPARWHKTLVICDGAGAYLDLTFCTDEAPTAQTVTSADDLPIVCADSECGYDWRDPQQNPYLLTGAELERTVAARTRGH